MIEVKTSTHSLHLFLILTGHAFEEHTPDSNPQHGFYWAQRWLARQVLGSAWFHWIAEPSQLLGRRLP